MRSSSLSANCCSSLKVVLEVTCKVSLFIGCLALHSDVHRVFGRRFRDLLLTGLSYTDAQDPGLGLEVLQHGGQKLGRDLVAEKRQKECQGAAGGHRRVYAAGVAPQQRVVEQRRINLEP